MDVRKPVTEISSARLLQVLLCLLPLISSVPKHELYIAWGKLASISPTIGTAPQSATCLKSQTRVQWLALGQASRRKAIMWRLGGVPPKLYQFDVCFV